MKYKYNNPLIYIISDWTGQTRTYFCCCPFGCWASAEFGCTWAHWLNIRRRRYFSLHHILVTVRLLLRVC